MKVFILIHTCCNFTSMFQSMFSSKIICLLVIECLYFLLSQLKRSLDYQNAVFAGCRARTPDPPRGRARTVPARGARRVPRASTRHECNPADARRYSRRRGAGEAARQRVSSRPRKEECWDLERRDSHRQGQKRRRRDARAGVEAPKARCTGRVRSAECAMHGQGQKRRRRDARAGSEAHLRIWSSTWSSTRC